MSNIFYKLKDFFDRPKEYNIAITGLSQTGKTIFLTSVIDNILKKTDSFSKSLNYQFAKLKVGSTFEYEDNIDRIRKGEWPEGTKDISTISIELYGSGEKHLKTLNFMDYPGEWILDFQLLNRKQMISYLDWSSECTKKYKNRASMKPFYNELKNIDLDNLDNIKRVSELYKGSLKQLKKEHYYDLTPGRFVMDDEIEDKEDLYFFPLMIMNIKEGKELKKTEVFKYCENKFKEYKHKYIKPDLKRFKKFDSQIIFIDVFEMLYNGEKTYNDIEKSIKKMIEQYEYNDGVPWSKQIEKLAIVGTKADLFNKENKANYKNLLGEIWEDNSGISGNDLAVTEHFIISSVEAAEVNDKGVTVYENKSDGKLKRATFRLPEKLPNVSTFKYIEKLEIPEMRTHIMSHKSYGAKEAIKSSNIDNLLKFLIMKEK